jgi:hypothetical protein
MSKKPWHISCFAELIIKPLVSPEKDKYLSLASLAEIRHFLPNIDTSANLDLLPVAFDACVINRVNKNKDVIDTQTALAVYKNFINKPINVEHNRQKVIGVILTAGFSEFGTDRVLTEEEVRGLNTPFNITLGGVVWRVICPELADHIEESNDPTSDKYLTVSASWELGFTDYKVALMDGGVRNLAEAKIVNNPEEVDKIKEHLTSCGGTGKLDDLFVYRMPSENVIPLGIGFTTKPAAEVVGIATKVVEQANLTTPNVFHNEPQKDKVEPASIPDTSPPAKTVNLPYKETFGSPENKNKISQSTKTDVKKERNTTMKIKSIADITDESLKECSASAVSEFIAAELKKGSDEWEKQKNSLNTQLAEAQANSQKLLDEHNKLQEQMQQVKATVDALQTEKTEREKVELFNSRMGTVAEQFDLDDEARAAIVDEIKSIASDEEFAKWQARAKVLLKGFAKMTPPAKKKNDVSDKPGTDEEDKNPKNKEKDCKGEADDTEAKKKKAKASEDASASTIVDDAIDNGKKDNAGLPNGTSASQPTLIEKFKGAFAKENFVISV